MPEETETDWKAIAMALGQRVNFAINNLAPKGGGSGQIMTVSDGDKVAKLRNWKEHFADAIDLIPGIQVDREVMHANSLPKKERAAWFKKNRPNA
jgi:hypothetical protein